jgi:hypothetical protein
LSGNFPALISSSVASLNPRPSFPSLAQSADQSQGEKTSSSSAMSPLSLVAAGPPAATSAGKSGWGMKSFLGYYFFFFALKILISVVLD